MEIMMHDVLRWLHVIFAAYWLGGEWGVFNASTNVANAKLSFEDRMRHMETAYRIDILPRSAIISAYRLSYSDLIFSSDS